MLVRLTVFLTNYEFVYLCVESLYICLTDNSSQCAFLTVGTVFVTLYAIVFIKVLMGRYLKWAELCIILKIT